MSKLPVKGLQMYMRDSVEEGNVKIVENLIKMGISVNNSNETGYTPLHIAAGNNNLEMLDILLKAGAEIDAANGMKCTALHISLFEQNKEAALFLLDKGANPVAKDDFGNTCLHIASGNGDIEILQKMVSLNANINVRSEGGVTPLHYAVSAISTNDCLATVKFFLDNGADIHAVDDDGCNVLFNAAYKGNVELLEFLLSKGLDVNVKNKAGMTPVQFAMVGKNQEAVVFLLSVTKGKEEEMEISGEKKMDKARGLENDGWIQVKRRKRKMEVE